MENVQTFSTDFRTVLNRLADAHTSYDIFKILKKIAALHDLHHFIVFEMPAKSDADGPSRVVLTNWESEVLHYCAQTEMRTPAGFFPSARDTVLPTSEAYSSQIKLGGDAGKKQALEYMIAHGHDAYAFFPLRSSRRNTGGIALTGTRHPLCAAELMQLSYILLHAFEYLQKLLEDDRPSEVPLSEREHACLRAAAQGMSAADAARHLGITAHTVNYHMNSAVKKLDARNKTHAVAKALQSNWISLN